MLKKTALTISLLLATVSSGHTQFIVSDPELIAEFLVEIEEIYKQVQAAQDQLAKAKQMYESVTGNRNFGDLFSKDNIDKLMPQDMQGLYSDLNKNGISGPVESILNAEKLNGSVDEMSKAISDRQKDRPRHKKRSARKPLKLPSKDSTK